MAVRNCLHGRVDSNWLERIDATRTEVNNADLILGIAYFDGQVYIEAVKQRIPFTLNEERGISQGEAIRSGDEFSGEDLTR